MQEPRIFTKHVLPFFGYFDPPHTKDKGKRPAPPGTTVRMDTDHYKHVEPKQEFTQALRAQRTPIRPPSEAGPSMPTDTAPSGPKPGDEVRLPAIVFTPDF